MATPPGDAPDRAAAARARIGHNIGAARQRHGPNGISQEALAAEMRDAGFPGWRQSTVHKAETGQRDVTAGELEGLALIFRVSAGRLLWSQGEDAEHASAGAAIAGLRQAAAAAADAVATLHAARSTAARAITRAERSSYRRVRDVAAHIDGELREATLRNVLATAWRQWEHMRDGG